MSEMWRDIPGWEGFYQASSEGQIRALDRTLSSGRWGHVRRKGGLMATKISASGYKIVGLRANGERKWFGVHRLVCMAFHGLPPEGKPFATHFPERDRLNCRAENLRWASEQQNSADKIVHGTVLMGAKNPAAKLSDDHVAEIGRQYRPGRPHHEGNGRQLAARYGVCRATITSAFQRAQEAS
jgi:hypothetical protein